MFLHYEMALALFICVYVLCFERITYMHIAFLFLR